MFWMLDEIRWLADLTQVRSVVHPGEIDDRRLKYLQPASDLLHSYHRRICLGDAVRIVFLKTIL